jgi:uncharacterized protein
MDGEKDLAALLATLEPELHTGQFVFCTVPNTRLHEVAVMTFKEREGTTLILEKQIADQQGLPYSFVAAWITLTVHSSLQAVGLTAAVAAALANENISCNVVAGYYHDHLFVESTDGQRALHALRLLAKQKTP